MPEFPIIRPTVENAVAAENLRARAAATDDPDLLLGLAYLAKAGDPVRQEISQRLVTIKPEYEPITIVLAIAMDGPDEASVAAILRAEPDNALGHYLQANLLRRADRDDEALEAFRRAAACRELRLYEPVTSAALLKALDALELQGRDRLFALSWIASKYSNFSIRSLQPLDDGLMEIARLSANDQRDEISDLLLILAGHLYSTNFHNRWYAQRALQRAFRLKAELAGAQDSPMMYGYAAATQALVSTMRHWPAIGDSHDLEQVAQWVPSRIHRAFLVIDPQTRKEEKLELSPEARAAYQQARQNEVEAAEALIEAAMENPDEIVGAYLKGLIVREEDARHPWVSRQTYVERAMSKWPAAFKATIRSEEAMQAVYQAESRDPRHQNLARMMVIAEKLITYAFKHDNQLPHRLDVLIEQKLLESWLEPKSVLTGRPYVYVGAGQKLPEKKRDRYQFILLYDDHEIDGKYQLVLAIPGGGEMPIGKLKEQIKAQEKLKDGHH